ncbi:MAG TPA: metalloregulator ArsR/SmtB family transcription factor [Candidatus Dormibacteraeota bacterium]|nr:metalloregulator ArsR/SmtB family transcription factor [Candidatus Dormibacteraeota bacterium]
MVERYSAVLDRTYGALSHPVRRQLLELLKPGAARVTELAAEFDISLAATSKHIQVLEGAGLVVRRIDGRDHMLTARPQPLGAARDWIERYRTYWDERLDALDAQLRRGRR